MFAHPGANALVIGAGSGSGVIGRVRVSLNVVAVEKDPTQFRGCKARLLGYLKWGFGLRVNPGISFAKIAQPQVFAISIFCLYFVLKPFAIYLVSSRERTECGVLAHSTVLKSWIFGACQRQPA